MKKPKSTKRTESSKGRVLTLASNRPQRIAAEAESDYPGKGSFNLSMEIVNNWPLTRYQTMYGRVFEAGWSLGKIFEELQQIRLTLQRDPYDAVADHAGVIQKIKEACKLLEMGNASLSNALTDMERLEWIAKGTPLSEKTSAQGKVS